MYLSRLLLVGILSFLVVNFCDAFGARRLYAAEQTAVKSVREVKGLPSRIAFGSCGHQDKPHPLLNTVVEKRPDVFIYLGDNIYGDTTDMSVLQQKYDKLGAKPEFQSLRREVAVLSVWDDHDYGANDAGKEYSKKEESREIFFDFWKVPKDSPRRKSPGIYGAYRFRRNGKTLQLILLDTRTFRDPLKRNPKTLPDGSQYKNEYQPDATASKSLLGEAQWQWLQKRFEQPADVRIVCSSIQFAHEYNGWESWTNLPLEQQKMIDLIEQTKASGVVFVSGDVHWGEISERPVVGAYPLHDVTASGITETWPTIEPNQFRHKEAVRENHFGQIDIDWSQADPIVRLQIIDREGTTRVTKDVPVSTISF